MPLLYRYIDKRDNTVKYVGVTGTKGRPDGVAGLALRDAEHFSLDADPIYQSGEKPENFIVQYVDGLTECEALAYETAFIGYYDPIFNSAKKGLGTFHKIDRLGVQWKNFERPGRTERKEKRERKRANGKTRGRPLSAEEISRLIKTIEADRQSNTRERDLLIVALILFTGMRLSDIVQLRVKDYDRANGMIAVDRKRGCPFPLGEARKYLEVILSHNKFSGGDFIFGSVRGNGISEKLVQYIVRKYGDIAEIDGCSVASLRETFRSRLMQNASYEATKELFEERKSKQSKEIYNSFTNDAFDAIAEI